MTAPSTTADFVMPPPIITRAIVRVLSPEFPADLSPALRWALSLLLRRVEANNGQADFWVRRCNFAALVDRCPKTISNWLNELESAGLIAREQARTGWGEFRCLTVRLTAKAVSALMLDQPIASRKFSSHAKEEDTCIQSFRDSRQGKISEESPPTLPSAKNHPTLPADLELLTRVGMRPTMVYSLMALCRAQGVRLGDVVGACSEQIKKARNAFAYIRGLLARGLDFAGLHAAHSAGQVLQAQAEQKNEALEAGWALIEGKTFTVAGKRLVAATRGPISVFQAGDGGAYLYLLVGEPLLRLVEKIGRGDLTITPA